MKLNMIRTLKGLNGAAAVNQEGKPVVVGDLYLEALLQDDASADGRTKLERLELSRKIYAAMQSLGFQDKETSEFTSEIEISVEQAGTLKDLVCRKYASPLIVGQLWELIEGA